MKYVALLTAAFGIGRFFMPATGQIHNDDIFKDVAHLFVGGLYGAAILATFVHNWLFSLKWEACCTVALLVQEMLDGICTRVMYTSQGLWALALGLTAVEVVAFLTLKN